MVVDNRRQTGSPSDLVAISNTNLRGSKIVFGDVSTRQAHLLCYGSGPGQREEVEDARVKEGPGRELLLPCLRNSARMAFNRAP